MMGYVEDADQVRYFKITTHHYVLRDHDDEPIAEKLL